MTETEEEYSSKVRTRVSTFDGDKAKWPSYKKKLESYLAQSGLSDLLTKKVGNAEESDDNVAPSGASDEVIEEVKRIQKMNQKAAGILLNSILTDRHRKWSIGILPYWDFHNAKAGYAGGQFYKEWMAMTTRYEEVESKSIADLKEEYYGAKMRDNQQPSLFIMQMEWLKIKMKEKNHDVSDEDFIHDILSKLLESKSSSMMNPHQIKKLFIKEKLTSEYTVDMLTIDLEKTYVKNIEDAKAKKGSHEGEKGFYTSRKTFKGKCYNCGTMGHMGKDCWSKNTKKGNNNTGYNNRNGGPKKKFMGTCNGCGKYGHKLVDWFKTKGNPNYKKGESANAARDKEEVAFMCMPCNEDEISHKSYSFEPVDNTIDDEGCPVPNSFFDSFGGSDKEDDETACYSAPEWYPSDEENIGVEEWCGIQEDPILEEKWVEVMHKKVNRHKTCW